MLLKKAIFIFLVIGLFLVSCLAKNETKTNSKQIAPNFILEDLSGKKVSLKDLRGKTVLLNFFATWCLPCIKKIPKLIQLNNKYSKSGLVILGINIQESRGKLVNFVNKKNINYSVLLDLDAKVANMYDVVGIPTYVLIDKNGNVQFYGHSLPDEKLIKSLLGEKLSKKKKI